MCYHDHKVEGEVNALQRYAGHYTPHTLTWSPAAAPLQWPRLSASDSSDSFETSAGEKSNTVTSARDMQSVRPSVCPCLTHPRALDAGLCHGSPDPLGLGRRCRRQAGQRVGGVSEGGFGEPLASGHESLHQQAVVAVEGGVSARLLRHLHHMAQDVVLRQQP